MQAAMPSAIAQTMSAREAGGAPEALESETKVVAEHWQSPLDYPAAPLSPARASAGGSRRS